MGAPDIDETFSSLAHCDDADYIDYAKYSIPGTYPRTRAQATLALLDCLAHLSGRFFTGLTDAKALLDSKDNIIKREVDLDGSDCTFVPSTKGRAKCNAIEGFGRSLHGTQDFYSHSSWSDESDSALNISITNPPGLGLPAPVSFLDLRSAMTPAGFSVPPELITGCFIYQIRDGRDTSGSKECERQGRLTHKTLNKDTGTINLVPGTPVPPGIPLTSGPTTPRGKISNNFELAVQGAILETRRQWSDFRAELLSLYGPKKASLIVCALTRDQPWKDCTGRKIALVIDSSGSNQDTDPSNLRISAAQEFNAVLITEASVGPDNLPDKVTVIDFDTSAQVVYPLGDPASASFDGIDSDGGTFIAGGVTLAIQELTKDTTVATQDHAGIIVFTDGQDSDIGALIATIDDATSKGIRVSFGFLSPPPNPVPRRSKRRSAEPRARAIYPRQSTTSLPSDLLAAVLRTGGVFATIDSAEAQRSFTQLVLAHGATNIDSITSNDGGPLFLDVTVVALTSAQSPDVFTYHATAGQNLTFKTEAITSGALNVTLHDVRASRDLSTVATNAQGVSNIVYQAPMDVDLELIVTTATGAPSNSTAAGLYSVQLQLTNTSSPSSPGSGSNSTTCNIPTNAPCQTIGEMKCCGTGFVTCDHAGYVVRECGPGTVCKSSAGDLYCGYP